MIVATYLLLAVGILGATDIALFHSASHGIRSHPDSRLELVTHGFRGPTYATLFVIVPNFALHGTFFWALVALLIADVGISIWDFSLERRSRRFLGGLPSGEYVLHVLIAMVFGAMVAAVFFEAGAWARMPTRLSFLSNGVPTPVRALLAVMAVMVLVSGIQDGLAAFRMRKLPDRSVGSPPDDDNRV